MGNGFEKICLNLQRRKRDFLASIAEAKFFLFTYLTIFKCILLNYGVVLYFVNWDILNVFGSFGFTPKFVGKNLVDGRFTPAFMVLTRFLTNF